MTVMTPTAGKVAYVHDMAALLADAARVAEIRADILTGTTYVMKSGVTEKMVMRMREYLTGVGRSSIPNYQPIKMGAPNFHRVNYWDPRAHVKGCFHQFCFFPWNQDLFDFFNLLRPIFQVKNLLSGLPAEKFLGMTPDDGCTARLAFQFYPKGIGGLNRHVDPVDHHQLCVPIMLMSRKGEDFHEGGLYIVAEDGRKIYFDELGEPGDVVFFNAQCVHGVDRIDPDEEANWPAFEGRWMGLFAVNKLFNNAEIADSVDLGD